MAQLYPVAAIFGIWRPKLSDNNPISCTSVSFEDKLVAIVAAPDAMIVKAVCAQNPNDVLLLERRANVFSQTDGLTRAHYQRFRDLAKHNCTILMLHGVAALSVWKKKYFWSGSIEWLLVPKTGAYRLLLPFLKRYSRHKILNPAPDLELNVNGRKVTYRVFRLARNERGNRKVYAPGEEAPLTTLNGLRGVNHVLLRAFERIESDEPFNDLDILVEDEAALELRERFSERVGTQAIDVYTVRGTGGHDYQSVPYILPKLASDALASAVVRPSGIRAPSADYAFLTLIYHLLFHGKSRHFDVEDRRPITSSLRPKHQADLKALCDELERPVPASIAEMEDILRERNYFPGRDLLGFYAKGNRFIAERYLEKNSRPAGLATFFVRDFSSIPLQTKNVRETLQRQFRIVAEGELDQSRLERVTQRVRGGNWYDRTLNDTALPVHWFVCEDDEPVKPAGKLAKRYPHLDNEKYAKLKLDLRKQYKDRRGLPVRFLHASDNTDEALEHIDALNLSNDPRIAEAIARYPMGDRH